MHVVSDLFTDWQEQPALMAGALACRPVRWGAPPVGTPRAYQRIQHQVLRFDRARIGVCDEAEAPTLHGADQSGGTVAGDDTQGENAVPPRPPILPNAEGNAPSSGVKPEAKASGRRGTLRHGAALRAAPRLQGPTPPPMGLTPPARAIRSHLPGGWGGVGGKANQPSCSLDTESHIGAISRQLRLPKRDSGLTRMRPRAAHNIAARGLETPLENR